MSVARTLGTAATASLLTLLGVAGASGGGHDGGEPGSGGAAVTTVVARATLTAAPFVTVAATCPAATIPVNGFWTVDGATGVGNQAVFYNLGPTGETATGYQVVVGRNTLYLGPDPVVEATARCLHVDGS